MPLTLEYDDFPRDAGHFLEMADRLGEQHEGFRCTVFAIPAEMEPRHWRQLDKRRGHIVAAPHGFDHRHWECTEQSLYERRLDDLCADDRWAPLFKAPWYEYTPEFIQSLHDRGWSFALKSMHPIPYPAAGWWQCWDRWHWAAADGAQCHLRTHPRRGVRKRLRQSHSITAENVAEWSRCWADGGWEFAHELLTCVQRQLDMHRQQGGAGQCEQRYDTVWCPYNSPSIAKALRAVRPGGEVRLPVPYTRPLRIACEVLGVAATIRSGRTPHVVLRGPMVLLPLRETEATLKKWLRR